VSCAVQTGREKLQRMTPEAVVPVRERERMRKRQDMILKAMAKNLSWLEAAEIAGMSGRNRQRKRQAYLE
jgi:hypothetical protein